MLRRAAGQLRRPELLDAVAIWKHQWKLEAAALEEERRRAEAARAARLAGGAAALEAELQHVRDECQSKLHAVSQKLRESTREVGAMQTELERARAEHSEEVSRL